MLTIGRIALYSNSGHFGVRYFFYCWDNGVVMLGALVQIMGFLNRRTMHQDNTKITEGCYKV